MTSSAFEATKTATANGTTLAYRETGEGEAVVFVHGSLSDLRVWNQQLPEIGRNYRAISYSRRYARPNADIEPGLDDQMLPHVEDLAVFLKAIDAAPAHLVGNSWGAFISLLTAMRHPDLVRSLVLEEPPVVTLLVPSLPPRPLELLRLFAKRPRTAWALTKMAMNTLVPFEKAARRGDDEEALRIFAMGAGGREAWEQLPQARLEQMRENYAALRAQLLGAGFPPLRDEDVRATRTPTLLLTGEHSPPMLLRMTDRLHELLPNAERLEIPDASHAMHEENAPAVNSAILRFLGRQRVLPSFPPRLADRTSEAKPAASRQGSPTPSPGV